MTQGGVEVVAVSERGEPLPPSCVLPFIAPPSTIAIATTLAVVVRQ